jgi:hypothetical protein
MTLILRSGLVVTALFAAMPAYAHHGWGGNVDEVSDMTGTVVEGVRLAGPHATMKVKVGANVWDITLAPPARAARAGLAEGLIPVGATVTVRGNRNRDPARYEMKTIMVRYGSRQFDVYPERE